MERQAVDGALELSHLLAGLGFDQGGRADGVAEGVLAVGGGEAGGEALVRWEGGCGLAAGDADRLDGVAGGGDDELSGGGKCESGDGGGEFDLVANRALIEVPEAQGVVDLERRRQRSGRGCSRSRRGELAVG